MLPSDFIDLISPIFADEMADFEAAVAQPPVVSVRLNDKISLPQFADCEAVAWCESGRYLTERPNFTLDPLLHAGAYYVQEASSMFLQQALNHFVDKNARMLDFCAAPGGKTTLIAQHLTDGVLVANEFVRQRAYILAENVQKWGSPQVIVTNNATSDFADFIGVFDAILVDAPCSGEGMFRKDANAIDEWSLQNVQQCVARQRQILSDAWKCLKTNGILIYSTCTYNSLENEENVRWLCQNYDAEVLRIPLDDEWRVTETAEGYHFYPHRTRGEGLFLIVIRKKQTEQSANLRVKNAQKNLSSTEFANYLKNADEYALFEQQNGLKMAFLQQYADLLQFCLKRLNVLHFGVPLAESKGKDLIPQAGLALSKALNVQNFATAEVDLPTALSFLRCEAINLPDAPRGFLLLTYQNLPIGWVKNIGNRCNNLYPQPWRIRHL